MNNHRRILVGCFIFIALISSGHSLYGRKHKKRPSSFERCTKFDPIAQPNTNLNDISGTLWYAIRRAPPNPSDALQRGFTSTDVTARWFHGSNTSIITERMGRDPGYCSSLVFQLTKIPGRNAYTFFGSATQSMEEYRIIYHSKEFLIQWVCFEFDKWGNCINSAMSLLTSKPDLVVNSAILKNLDRIVFRATCELTVSRDFKNILSRRKACPDVRLFHNEQLCLYYGGKTTIQIK